MSISSLSNAELYALTNPYTSSDIERTKLACLELLSRDKECYPAVVSLGKIYSRAGDLESAVQYFSLAKTLMPPNASLCFELGNAYSNRGKITDAIDHYKEGLALKPGDTNALNVLASMYVRLGRLREAQPYIDQVLAAIPDDRLAITNQVLVYKALGDIERAIELLLTLRPHEQEDPYDLIDLADLYRLSNQPEKAVEVSLDSVRLFPDSASALHEAARSYGNAGKLDFAKRYYRRALEREPENAIFMLNFANMLDDNGRPYEARELYISAIQHTENSGLIFLNLGTNAMRRNASDEAVEHLRKAMEFEECKEDAWIALAKVLRNSGKPDEARKQLQLMLTTYPNHKTAAHLLELLVEERGPGSGTVQQQLTKLTALAKSIFSGKK